jgi:hypothetical protein
MVFNATFNNISIISWRSVLLLVLTDVRGEIHRPAASHWHTLSHNVVSSKTRLNGIRFHNVSGVRHSLHMSLKEKWDMLFLNVIFGLVADLRSLLIP